MRDSRRARVVVALLVLIAFTMIALDFRAGSGSPLDRLRTGAAAVFGPVERAVADVVRPIGDALSSLGHIGSYRAQIGRLQRENAALQQQVDLSDAYRRELTDLRALFHLAGKGRFRVVAAQVVALGDGGGFEWTASIDAGSRDGIRRDMTVVNGQGLVGKTVTVGPSVSTVLLSIDPQAIVGVRLAGSGTEGTVTGAGLHHLQLSLLDPQARLRPGQRLVTLASIGDRPYVPGAPVGTITRVDSTPGSETRTAEVAPFVDFAALDVVGVIVGAPARDPRDSLLPPPPAAALTPCVVLSVPAVASSAAPSVSPSSPASSAVLAPSQPAGGGSEPLVVHTPCILEPPSPSPAPSTTRTP